MAAEEKQWASERVDLWAHRHDRVVVVFEREPSWSRPDVVPSPGQFGDEVHAKNSPASHVLL